MGSPVTPVDHLANRIRIGANRRPEPCEPLTGPRPDRHALDPIRASEQAYCEEGCIPPRTAPDFDEVLAAARSGAEWAWGRLYDDLAPPLWSYLRMRGASDPGDVLGEVFLHVVRDLHTFKGDEDGFRSWVFTIAHRRIVDDHRRRSRRPVEVSDEDLPPNAEPATTGEPDAVTNLATEDLLDTLDTLTDDQRDAIALRVVAGMAVPEIATAMERTPGAVKALQLRGLRTLRREMGLE